MCVEKSRRGRPVCVGVFRPSRVDGHHGVGRAGPACGPPGGTDSRRGGATRNLRVPDEREDPMRARCAGDQRGRVMVGWLVDRSAGSGDVVTGPRGRYLPSCLMLPGRPRDVCRPATRPRSSPPGGAWSWSSRFSSSLESSSLQLLARSIHYVYICRMVTSMVYSTWEDRSGSFWIGIGSLGRGTGHA